MNTQWKPSEIIIHRKVEDDPVTKFIKEQVPDVPTKIISNGDPKSVIQASSILRNLGNSMLEKLFASKRVLFVAPVSNDTVDTFSMPEDRVLCPHFNRLKLASNGSFGFVCNSAKNTHHAFSKFLLTFLSLLEIN